MAGCCLSSKLSHAHYMSIKSYCARLSNPLLPHMLDHTMTVDEGQGQDSKISQIGDIVKGNEVQGRRGRWMGQNG